MVQQRVVETEELDEPLVAQVFHLVKTKDYQPVGLASEFEQHQSDRFEELVVRRRRVPHNGRGRLDFQQLPRFGIQIVPL